MKKWTIHMVVTMALAAGMMLMLLPVGPAASDGRCPEGNMAFTEVVLAATDGDGTDRSGNADAQDKPVYSGTVLISWPQGKSADVVEIEEDCEQIANGAFTGSGRINKVVIPPGCNIEPRAFLRSKVASLQVPSGSNPFRYEDGMIMSGDGEELWTYLGGNEGPSCRVPDTVKTIAPYAFDGNEHLRTVYMGDQVTYIGGYAFRNCTGLTEVRLPDTGIGHEPVQGGDDGVMRMGDGVFWGCTGLTEMTLSSSLRSIPRDLFRECRNLRRIEIPEGVETLCPYAFWTGGTINEFIVRSRTLAPARQKESDGETFADWSDCLPVSAGASNVQPFMDDNSFRIAGDLTYVYAYRDSAIAAYLSDPARIHPAEDESYTMVYRPLGEDPANLPDHGSCGRNAQWSVSGDGKTLTISGSGTTSDYVLDAVEEPPWMWRFGDTIERIVIEDGITSIGEFSFFGMPKVREVSFPESLAKVQRWGFANCPSLRKVEFPGHVQTLHNYAFAFCENLRQVIIHAKADEIRGAFMGCKKLFHVVFEDEVDRLRDLPFAGCDDLQTLDLSNVLHLGYDICPGCGKLDRIDLSKVKGIEVGSFKSVQATVYYAPPADQESCLPLTDQNYGGDLEWIIGNCEHSWDAYDTVDMEAACTDEGWKSRHCSLCGKRKDITDLPALGHDMDFVEARAATEDDTGNIAYWHCIRCGENYGDETGERCLSDEEIVTPRLEKEDDNSGEDPEGPGGGDNSGEDSGSSGGGENSGEDPEGSGGGENSGEDSGSSGGGENSGEDPGGSGNGDNNGENSGSSGGGDAPGSDPADPSEHPSLDPEKQTQRITGKKTFVKPVGKRFSLGLKAKTAMSYRSSNKSVATVDDKGYVKVRGCGKCSILVTASETAEYEKAVLRIKVRGKLAKPVLKARSKSGRKIKLSWGKVSGAKGYLLYVKIPGSKKYRLAVSRSARVKSVTHRGLSKGKVYRYKLRAVTKVGRKTYYSPFSKAVKVRVKS